MIQWSIERVQPKFNGKGRLGQCGLVKYNYEVEYWVEMEHIALLHGLIDGEQTVELVGRQAAWLAGPTAEQIYEDRLDSE